MNNHPKKTIINRRCDEPMRRSKEKTHRWKCTGKCKTCICGITIDQEGNEEHVNPLSKVFKRIVEDERLSATKK